MSRAGHKLVAELIDWFPLSKDSGTSKGLAVIIALFTVTQAWAESGVTSGKKDGFDRLPPAPKELKGIDVVENIGAQIPADKVFVDETGKKVVLGELLDDELPTILTFNYSSCPMLCSLQLSSLVRTLKKMPLVAGKHFRIVTIGIDPKESAADAARTKSQYLSRFPSDEALALQSNWHFLIGAEADVRAIADLVGFGYRYLPERKEYAHSTALILVSPAGEVTSYIKGIHYQPSDLVAAIVDAGMNRKGASLGFALSCFQYDSGANNYSGFASNVMRWGGITFVTALMFIAWFMMYRYRARRSCSQLPALGTKNRRPSVEELVEG